MNNARIKVKNKRKRKRIIGFILFPLLMVLVVGGFYLGFLFNSASQAANNTYEELESETNTPITEPVKIKEDPMTILLIGVENQEGGKGRSDVLMLLTVNPSTEEVYLLSIPRDTRTYIPEVGYKDKITHSYSFGGTEATVEAVKELLDIPINYYITTNFQGFEDVVDSLDGITVDVPFTFKAQLTGSLKWKTYYEGKMDLNGNEALAFVRMRKSDPLGDAGRNERQKQIVKTIVDKGTSFGSLTKIDDVLNDVGENVKTNIPPKQLLNFVQLYNKMKNSQIQSLTLEGYDEYINELYYYIPEEDSINYIHTTLTESLNSTQAKTITDTKEENESTNNNVYHYN